jgi:transcriptional regulator with XRE-family HTH domain
MERTVAREILDNWIGKNSPDGISRLALKSKVSSSLISKVRNGLIPKKEGTRTALARALGVTEAELFPLARERAS